MSPRNAIAVRLLLATILAPFALPASAQRLGAPRDCPKAAARTDRTPPAEPEAVGGPAWVRWSQKINQLEGGFTGLLDDNDQFGESICSLGDIDGDGVGDLAVGAWGDQEGGVYYGCAWVLLLNADGTVKAQQKINSLHGGFSGELDESDSFGKSVCGLDDLDGDGIDELVVGAHGDDDGWNNAGAVWVLFLNADGTVRTHQKISATEGDFTGDAFASDAFGYSVTSLGDFDGDGVGDLAVGVPGDDDGTQATGSVYLLFLRSDGTVREEHKISATEGGFTGTLLWGDHFGESVALLGDLDGDGVPELAVGTGVDDDGGISRGAVWVLFLNADGTVRTHQKISSLSGGFTGVLDNGDQFGRSIAGLPDIDGNGVRDLVVGACLDDDLPSFPFPSDAGAVWILFLNADGTVRGHQKISPTEGGFTGLLEMGDLFGRSVASLGDLDGDGVAELAVGEFYDHGPGLHRGAAWILSLDGLVSLDFQTEDDLRTQLVNGQEITAAGEMGRVVTVEGFPASGLTAAIFDSTPGGPNAAGNDPDLLVGRGNVLILQETPWQNVPGIYVLPDDDRLGGRFLIEFEGAAVTPLSLELIDIDQPLGQEATVTLMDAGGRARVYYVPAGWTEDIDVDGPPGFRTLDLTLTTPQPGFLATAVALEDPGFDPTTVVTLEVHVGGSAGLDTLIYDPHP